MSYLKSLGTTFIYIGAFFAIITFIPGIPPDAKFSEYNIVPPKALTDDFSSKATLNNPEILFEGKVKGAESFASYNGELYTGVHGGYVVKVLGDKLVPIVKFGTDCEGLWQESKCGRPLGLKFDKQGFLYVCDAYYGIFKVNVSTGKYEKIVDIKEAIEGVHPKIINSIDIASNGDLYWSDSSSEFTIEDGVYSMMANPSGRLIRYDAKTKKNQVLVYNLGFANGVLLNEDESFVIVLETLTSRITKYNIKGPNAGKHEIFIEGLPGLPDNVHTDNNKGFLVSLIVYADADHPQLTQSLMPHPYIRRMLSRLMALTEAPFKCLNSYYPNPYFEKLVHFIGHFESMTFLSPKIVTVLRINENGKIIDSAYGTNGNVTGISSAFIHREYLWLGSPFENYIARVPLKSVFPGIEQKPKSSSVKKDLSKEKTR